MTRCQQPDKGKTCEYFTDYNCIAYQCKKETDELDAKINGLAKNIVTIQSTLKAVALQVNKLAVKLK